MFQTHAGIDAPLRDIATLPYQLSLIRAHPRELMDSPQMAEAVKAMRTLARVMPGLVDRAEAIANRERRAGRASWTDRYAMHGRALLAAIDPFTLDRRDARGWWHGWARSIAVDIRLILRRSGSRASFSNPSSPAVLILRDLMASAGHSVTETAIIDALKE